MGSITNLEFMRINTMSLKCIVILKLPYSKIGDMLLKTRFLACPTRMDGPS